MHKKVFIFLIVLFAVIGCNNRSADLFLVYNQAYFSIFEEEKALFLDVSKFFKKNYYKVNVIKSARFDSLIQEFDLIKNRTKDSPQTYLFFLDNMASNIFTSNLQLYPKANYKIITYNYDVYNKEKMSNQSLINFYPDNDTLYYMIVNEIKRFSDVTDCSDITYLYSSAYSMPIKISDKLKINYPNITQVDCNSKNSVKIALNNYKENTKSFFVFCFDYNMGITEQEIEFFNDKNVIEIMTNLGEGFPFISSSILINNVNLVEHALNSKELNRYLLGKQIGGEENKTANNESLTTPTQQNNVTNVPLKYKNIVEVKHNKQRRKRLSIILEEKIKENNMKKQK